MCVVKMSRLQLNLNYLLRLDLKALNFHASEDLSGVFQRLLNESFVSLRELSFYHPNFMSKLNYRVAFPPNLQVLRSSVTPSTILDFSKHLILVSLEVDCYF